MNHESPLLSFIIPVRNQCRDLTLFLFELHRHFESRTETFEVIIMDDGSKDQTPYVVERLAQQFKTIKLVTAPQSRGLGAAARAGLLESRGVFSMLIRPGHSFEAVDELLDNLDHSYQGVLFGSVPLRSSLWPPELFLLSLWKIFDRLLSLFVKGGASGRLSPIIFSREVGRELAVHGQIFHAGYQFELILLAQKKSVPITLRRLTAPFVTTSFPLFYFLTVVKEVVRGRVRLLKK